MQNFEEAKLAMEELLEAAAVKPGDIVVIGCSTSEVLGSKIGTYSSEETAQQLYAAIAPVIEAKGCYLAAQCCEHLNRSLIIEAEAAEKYGYEPVWVVPKPKAGGSFGTTAWKQMKHPVAVEHVRAVCGMDIGGTLIGMHLKEVAVPVRLSVSQIGEARIICAKTRPKYVGGPRACYE
ncbi:MAG: TIGR01440 family protein [Firmicutes bacterium]|nr:TIGR01440 family protein [Bacillota bacterium]